MSRSLPFHAGRPVRCASRKSEAIFWSRKDGSVLANTIERCFQSSDFSANRMKAYENARRKQTMFVQRQSDRTARLTTTENRFNYWLGKRIIRKTGRNKTLMRTALKASAGLSDHFSIREQLRFII